MILQLFLPPTVILVVTIVSQFPPCYVAYLAYPVLSTMLPSLSIKSSFYNRILLNHGNQKSWRSSNHPQLSLSSSSSIQSLYSTLNDHNNDNDILDENDKKKTKQPKSSIMGENENIIPGKTSAIPGAKDYEINIPQTELKWYDQADDVERKVKEMTTQGMNAFKLLKLQEAAYYFQKVYQLNPNAYCWQYGIVLFYLQGEVVDQQQEEDDDDPFEKAAKMFLHNAKQCEVKFQIPASEERIWYYACCLKMNQNKKKKKKKKKNSKKKIPYISRVQDFWINEDDEDNNNTNNNKKKKENTNSIYETRKVIRLVRELFEASIQGDGSAVALIRAQLYSIATGGGLTDHNNNNTPTTTTIHTTMLDRKMWKLTAWFYLGLHFDSLGDVEQSKKCLKMALRQCATSGNGVDVMHILPMLHMTVRDWYDDDDFEEDILIEEENNSMSFMSLQKIVIPVNHNENDTMTTAATTTKEDVTKETRKTTFISKDMNNYNTTTRTTISNTTTSEIHTTINTCSEIAMIHSIKESIEKMKLVELQTLLKNRKMKSSGSKSILQARLLVILLEEAGLSH